MSDELDRISLTLPPAMVARLDEIVEEWEYDSRSGAVRDGLREFFAACEWEADPEGRYHGTIVVVHEHDHDSDVAGELQTVQHEQADIILSLQHIHLSHDRCMETIAVDGPGDAIRELANRLRSVPGVQRVTFVIGDSATD
ncbi:CopG family ribbon-helix-helix protein [Natronobacterium gregoryi]|nr:ribbon-helix-helix protein, CopG family [Natronobacterium gregoryi]AFZ72216.1 putative transcriptional regulator with CopG/Arc/MetJ DNA-binding domain and metal-binding domain [Natronobacterium gregoryi SP2]PLK20224.1 ribbon-helix-helix protein, CopG family [Natronobacterium gregoryi SP2]SFJ28282.1 transcriptional regulator, CopG family [Natronobacterium gregoryi]